MGVAHAGRGQSVAVDVDPNIQKKSKKIQYSSGGYPRFSQPAKTAYQHRDPFQHNFVKSTALVGWVWCDALARCELRSPQASRRAH